ncbi:MAG TPA: SIMPL domain-containing protein, partial [Candidatus Elarobacter sp.]|nr:SIMPL domain-containing protein [Candidatus Elarobacter sp.]
MTMLKRFTVLGLVLLPLAASAQIPVAPRGAPAAPSAAGITVQGRGVARFPVKDVQFQAYAHGSANEADVLAALRAAGVENPVIGPPGPQLSANGPTVMRGTVRNVTRAKLDALGRAAVAYMAAHPGATLDSVTFTVPTDACAAHEDEARNAAIADARRRAQAIAALTGVAIQGVTYVSENGGCPLTGDGFQGPPSQLDLGT